MGRPKKYADAAARKAALQRAKRDALTPNVDALTPVEALMPHEVEALTPAPGDDTLIPVRHQSHVPIALFDSVRRGTPRTHTDGKSYVMIARSAPSLIDGHVYDDDAYAVIPAADWHTRLGQRCEHGYSGWACHAC